KEETTPVTSDDSNFEDSRITDTNIPTIVCSYEDKDDLETSNQNVKDVDDENELELMINQRLMRTRSSVSGDLFSIDPFNFSNKAEGLKKKQVHGEVCSDLSTRPLSLSSSAESSLKGNFYYNEKYSSGNEHSHQPSEEITSDTGEIKPSLINTSSDELVQLYVGTKEVLDDNANPAQGKDRMKISCLSSAQSMVENLKKHEGGTKEMEIKDWECLRTDIDLKESIAKGSFKKNHGNGKDVEEQRIHLGINEKQNRNFQSIFQDQERQTGHCEISVQGTGNRNRDLTALPSRDTTIPTQAITADTFPSLRTNLNWENVLLTTPKHELLASEGTNLGQTLGQVCSPRNGNVLRNDSVFQVEKEKSDWTNPEDQNKNTQQKQIWNVLESQGKIRESKTNVTEQIYEQADCKNKWEKRDNTQNLKATPAEELFTCQETVSCDLSSLADHGINKKAEAGTAYIIKTTSESTLESMSAREKAIIAKLPQETARSDRPMEEKETAFDAHEGRNDDSHHTYCQRDAVGVIYNNDFEKESLLDICNVHIDEMKKEETISMYSPGKTHDRKKCGIRNTTSAEESLQAITDNQNTTSKLDLHLGMLPTDKKIFPEHRDHGQVQDLSKKMDTDTIIHSAFISDSNRASSNDSHISNHQVKNSVPTCEQAIAMENTITNIILQSISSKSEHKCDPTSKMQSIEKHRYPGHKPEEVSKSSGIMTLGSRRARSTDQIFHKGECTVEKSLGPMILVNDKVENTEEAGHENEGLITSGQSLCSSVDKESESLPSASLSAQESQAERSESLFSKCIHSKLSYFLLFLIFLVTIYYYDLMIGLAFYLFSLYWLSW
ncbi:Protein phosphatase 1 regulatory subunit 3A, partial [Galemys pyrenaicus]